MTKADVALFIVTIAAFITLVVIVATLLHIQADTRSDAVILRRAATAGGGTHRAP